MRVTLQYGPLTAEQRDAQSKRGVAQLAVKRKLREVSLALERRIKSEMPVDTGRARASWGQWTPGDVHENKDASAGDAIWNESEDGFRLEQGTNVPYVEGLNAGNSMQAPAGFLDRAELHAQQELDSIIDDLLSAL